MKQFAIYFHGMFILGHIVANNAEAAIAKFREHNQWVANDRLVAELV